jgi:response regulator NasT
MPLKVVLIDSRTERAEALERSLVSAEFALVHRVEAGSNLIETVEKLSPDLVIVDMALPDRDALEGIRQLSARTPRPVVMFSAGDDATFVEQAIAAGVCSYNMSDAAPRDIKPIVLSAIALFRRYQRVEDELEETKAQLAERRLIERAKAILMRNRKMSEPEAYGWLRRRAMNQNRKILQIALDLLKREGRDADRPSDGERT